jgi:hypothetical protein
MKPFHVHALVRHDYDRLSLTKSRFNHLSQDRNYIYDRCHLLTANFSPKKMIEIIEITSPKFINTSARLNIGVLNSRISINTDISLKRIRSTVLSCLSFKFPDRSSCSKCFRDQNMQFRSKTAY